LRPEEQQLFLHPYVKKWFEYDDHPWVIEGRKAKYPECCIRAFVDEDQPGREKRGVRFNWNPNGDGWVLCPDCFKRAISVLKHYKSEWVGE
jgi:hypothetical protein